MTAVVKLSYTPILLSQTIITEICLESGEWVYPERSRRGMGGLVLRTEKNTRD